MLNVDAVLFPDVASVAGSNDFRPRRYFTLLNFKKCQRCRALQLHPIPKHRMQMLVRLKLSFSGVLNPREEAFSPTVSHESVQTCRNFYAYIMRAARNIFKFHWFSWHGYRDYIDQIRNRFERTIFETYYALRMAVSCRITIFIF